MEKSAEGVSRGMMEKRGERAKTLIESCEIKGRRGESGRRVCVCVCVLVLGNVIQRNSLH